MEHRDVRYFWIQEQVRDEDFSIKKEKNCANVGTKPIFASVLQCCSNCKMGVLEDHGSHTPLQDEGEEPRMDLVNGFSPDVHRGLDMCTETLGIYTEIRCSVGDTNTETETEPDSCQC